MAKKDFKGNTAMNFISQDSIDKIDAPEAVEVKEKNKASYSTGDAIPKGYKLNPKYVETKTKRLNILLQPSVHSEIKAKAEAEGISVNEAISRAIKAYIGR